MSKKTPLLKVGDVIEIRSGHNVCLTSVALKTFEEDLVLDATDYENVLGEYVVYKTAKEGGGTGHGPHDVYPDGWHVFARAVTKSSMR